MSLLSKIQRIQAIVQSGLAYSKDLFDQERYEELQALSKELIATVTEAPLKDVEQFYSTETGYATPKVDVRALIVNQKGAILLVKDRGSHEWALPGGFADVGLSATENVLKEVREETGLVANVERLIAVYDTNKSNPKNLPVHYYKLIFRCQVESGQLTTSYETSEIGYFQLNQLPKLSERRTTVQQLADCYDLDNEQMILD